MVAILADDLTGACDATVHFAARGLRALVAIDPEDACHLDSEIVACNTGTRCSDGELLSQQLAPALALVRDRRPRILMKKVDSMLRGPVGQEIAWMLKRLDLPIAVMAPAFPGTGRRVRDGRVLLQGCEFSIDIANCLHDLKCAHASRSELGALKARIAEEIRKGTQVLIVDAEDDADLLQIVRVEREAPPLLWAGSGGLARALAEEFSGNLCDVKSLVPDGPVLVCVGSDHEVTAAQVEQLCREMEIVRADDSASGLAAAKAALEDGVNALVRFSREQIESEPDSELGEKVGVQRCGGIIATGGDTALYLLRSLGARAVELAAEVEPGIPWGEVRGGVADGKVLVTKSGGFGNNRSLLTCVEFMKPFAEREQKVDVS